MSKKHPPLYLEPIHHLPDEDTFEFDQDDYLDHQEFLGNADTAPVIFLKVDRSSDDERGWKQRLLEDVDSDGVPLELM